MHVAAVAAVVVVGQRTCLVVSLCHSASSSHKQKQKVLKMQEYSREVRC